MTEDGNLKFKVKVNGKESEIEAADIEEAVKLVKPELIHPISVDCTDHGVRVIYCSHGRDKLTADAYVYDPRVKA